MCNYACADIHSKTNTFVSTCERTSKGEIMVRSVVLS